MVDFRRQGGGAGAVSGFALPEFQGRLTDTTGFQVFTSRQFINKFWARVMEEEGGIIGKTGNR